VIFDCDNTMGLPNKDVDDGLTLMYLIGNKNIELFNELIFEAWKRK
jgi:inosine-uridine nucleoside N-ribohydrolase